MIEFIKASKLLERLQALIDEHGDLPICARDPDTRYRLDIGLVYKQKSVIDGWPDRFEVRTDYEDNPKGLINKD